MAVVPEVEAAAAGGKYAAYGLAVTLIAVAGFAFGYHWRQGAIDALNKANATQAQSIRTMTGQIGQQNAAIEGLQRAAKKSADDAKSALDAAHKASAPARAHALSILSQKPVAGVDLCVQARKLVDDELTKERAGK